MALIVGLAAMSCPALAAAETPGHLARAVLEATGVQGGLIVHLGCGDGQLTAALRANERFLVHGLDRSAENVQKARRHIAKLGSYGPVSVQPWAGKRLPYADNLVNLLVAEAPTELLPGEAMRVLCPKGVAYVKRDGRWTKTVKPWPKEIDEWTHWLHGADGNAVAADTVVAPPRSLQWAAKPLWSRHHNLMPSVSAMVSANGRLFTIVDEAPAAMTGASPDKWALLARDAFNGLKLWRLPIAEWGWRAWSARWEGRFNQPYNVAKRLVAAGDRVYVTLGFNAPLTAIDAATGKIVRTYEGTEFTDEILHLDGTLIVSINKEAQKPGKRQPGRRRGAPLVIVKQPPPVTKFVAAIDAATGEMLWKTGNFVGTSTKTGSVERITHLLLAARGDQVFLLDRDEVISLDLKSGRQRWKSPRPKSEEYLSRYYHRMSDMTTLMATDEVVLLCQLEPIQRRIGWGVIRARVQAYSTKTGERVWQYQCGSWAHFAVPDMFVTGGLAWLHDKKSMTIVGLDLATGAEKRRLSTRKALTNGHHHRCYRNKATERYLMTSYRGFEFVDWASNETHLNHWVRGGCRYGGVPCNGMLYATPHPCDCYITSKLNGLLALSPTEPVRPAHHVAPRLQRGPAYGSKINPQSAIPNPQSTDWPTYRHDSARTGHTAAAVSAELKLAWTAKLTGRLSAPVVAGGKVLVASVDTHRVYALTAGSGKVLWSYTAGGPVDTPPTLYAGLALFGCRDGWVYCLRAADGVLAWRFRAAPAERLVGAYGALESAWPVHGSVLIREGKAYVVAGRSSFLDGGIATYCLDPATGKVLAAETLRSPHSMAVDAGRNHADDNGVLADVLVSSARGVHMRQRRLFAEPDEEPDWGGRVSAMAGMLDDSWFNRTMWIVDGKACGELLVHDDKAVYAARAYEDRGHGGFHAPGTEGYRLVADVRPMAATRPVRDRSGKAVRRRWNEPIEPKWTRRVPLRIRAMALAGNTLLCAGTPDTLDPDDPWAVYEGRRGGLLTTYAAADGTPLAEIRLDAAPVYDGLAVTPGRLVLTTTAGQVLCFQGG